MNIANFSWRPSGPSLVQCHGQTRNTEIAQRDVPLFTFAFKVRQHHRQDEASSFITRRRRSADPRIVNQTTTNWGRASFLGRGRMPVTLDDGRPSEPDVEASVEVAPTPTPRRPSMPVQGARAPPGYPVRVYYEVRVCGATLVVCSSHIFFPFSPPPPSHSGRGARHPQRPVQACRAHDPSHFLQPSA